MQEYKTYNLYDLIDNIPMSREEWDQIRALPNEERPQAIINLQHWPEGFLEKLKGLPLQEQMKYYRIVEEEHFSRTAYGEITSSNMHRYGYALEKYSALRGLILDDGVLVGVLIKTYFHQYDNGAVMLPYRDICTYYASDDNGSGSNDREDYAHLCCVVPDEE